MSLRARLVAVVLALMAVVGTAAGIKLARKNASETEAITGSSSSIPRAHSFQSSTENIPHIVSLIKPTDVNFLPMLDLHYPQLRTLNDFQSVLPNIALIHNESALPIHAYVVKWVLLTTDGVPQVAFVPQMKTPRPDHVLTGGVVLQPGEVCVISPWFVLSRSMFANMRPGNEPTNALTVVLRTKVSVVARQATVATASLDGVVFGDATFTGPDEAKLLDRFECERNGQRDEALSIWRLLQASASDQQIINKLNEHIRRGWGSQASDDRQNLYYRARGTQAEMLLEILRQSGRPKLQDAVNRMLRFHRTSLQRIS